MSPEAISAVTDDGPLAIISGSGTLPATVAAAVQRRGRQVLLFGIRGAADSAVISPFPHHWLGLGQYGHFVRLARAAGCRDVVAIGGLVRPSLWNLRLDLLGVRQIPRLVRAFRNGDNGLLSGMGAMLEAYGFRVVGAHEVASEILMPVGAISSRKPGAAERADIRLALDLLQATGPFDIGQAVVVCDNRVLAVEAAEGTDQMLERLAELRRSGRVQARDRAGVLVKAPKPGQDRRFDLPTIGPRTVEGAAAAGLGGIAVVAGSTIVAEPDRIADVAERQSLFVVGIAADGTTP